MADVTPEEIASLITASGFDQHQLSETTHDIIARIDDSTDIKSLLLAICQAVDLSITTTYSPRHPRAQQVHDLLLSYNALITAFGNVPMSDDEIARVVAVAERDSTRWQSKSYADKIRERGPGRLRSPPSVSSGDPEPKGPSP